MDENESKFNAEQLQAIANIKQAMEDTKTIQQGATGEASSIGIYDDILAEKNGETVKNDLAPEEQEAKKMLGRVKFLLTAKMENHTRNEELPPANIPAIEASENTNNQDALNYLKEKIAENIEVLNPENNPTTRSNAELYKILASFAASEDKSR